MYIHTQMGRGGGHHTTQFQESSDWQYYCTGLASKMRIFCFNRQSGQCLFLAPNSKFFNVCFSYRWRTLPSVAITYERPELQVGISLKRRSKICNSCCWVQDRPICNALIWTGYLSILPWIGKVIMEYLVIQL